MKCTCFNSKHVTLYDRNYIKGKTEIKSRKVYKSLLHGAIAVRKGGGALAEPHLDYTWVTVVQFKKYGHKNVSPRTATYLITVSYIP